MNKGILLFPLMGLLLSGCMADMINQSTQTIHQNRYAVEESTRAIEENKQVITRSTETIKENKRLLDKAHAE